MEIQKGTNVTKQLRKNILSTFLIGLTLILIPSATFDSQDNAPVDSRDAYLLNQLGYRLDALSLWQVFLCRDMQAITSALDVAIARKYTTLVPAIRDCRTTLDPSVYWKFATWCDCTRALYILDSCYSVSEIENDMDILRESIFHKTTKGIPSFEVRTLMAAATYQHVNIKDDLIRLSTTDIMKLRANRIHRELFERYGNTLTDSEISGLRNAWKGSLERQAHIDRLAAEFGPASAIKDGGVVSGD